VSTDRRATSYNLTRTKALDFAEAGVAEALERIRSGDVPDNRNPRMVAQVFAVAPGSVPAMGPDSIGMPTEQPAGQWLPYSSATRGPDVLTVQYMTDATRTGIYFYDPTSNPAIQGKTGNPVFLIHSGASDGISHRQVDASVSAVTIQPVIKGALVGNDAVKLFGQINAIGYDYMASTPDGTGAGGVRNPAYETGTDNAPGVWAAGSINTKPSSNMIGTPNSVSNQPGFYTGPWDVLNMTQSDFYNWVGAPVPNADGSPMPSGIVYLSYPGDPPQLGSHNFRFSGGDGDGLLYVNGDLEIDGNFTYRGLIYVEGSVKLKGSGWILGSLVIADSKKLNANHPETLTILKSARAISRFINRHRSPFTVITWRES